MIHDTSCWIKEDGLETVKNKGRMDVKNRWAAIENKWVEIIYKQSGDESVQWIKPDEPLMYKVPAEDRPIFEMDFKKTVLDFFLYCNKETASDIVIKDQDGVLLSNSVEILAFLGNTTKIVDTASWRNFAVKDYFSVECSKYSDPRNYEDGLVPYVARSAFNNGVVKQVSTDCDLYPANCITIGAESAKAFYQPNPFLTGNKLYRLYAVSYTHLTLPTKRIV